ncbi:hypothetical protein Poli38472_004334 [Pythium oligandrum]|uniref:1,3-beta-glucanosyltransferase n=1 Tax=Pythium oligandrum TaxID=41045 RepID=A0A8K1FDB9_PYTOL|nr:hypothetical protein Poli38472_004334 [Pythium oligandrum]|eukprot:TMW59265.1 hypothetical protein Poli38472_004334 [Pythium oligandrum]
MKFIGFKKYLCAAALVLAGLNALASDANALAPPIVAKGNKFFNSETGEEFRLKGMAYYPRPNGGELANVGNYDWAADEHENVWRPHLEIMQQLGVNTIRLYSIDPSKSHDAFMCACSEAGIYVLVGMTAPCENCSVIDEKPPACYPSELFSRVQMVYNAMAVYDNTLGFSVGNENNLQIKHGPGGTITAPCVKALLRDARTYASSCTETLRQVPIGLDIADIPPRDQWLQYYDCVIDDDENTRADWLGFNPYVECDPLGNQDYTDSEGLQSLMKEYKDVGYSRPLMFGEFGCNEGTNTIEGWENQRSFNDAKWMNDEPEMQAEIVGGNVFEFTTEIANLQKTKKITKTKDPGKFGIGYFEPDNCDHDAIPCEFIPYPEFDNLLEAFTSTKPSKIIMESFKPTRTEALTCPKGVSTKLPPKPDVEMLACSARQPVCKSSNSTRVPKTTIKRKKTTVSSPSADADKTVTEPSSSSPETPLSSSHATSSACGILPLLLSLVVLVLVSNEN